MSHGKISQSELSNHISGYMVHPKKKQTISGLLHHMTTNWRSYVATLTTAKSHSTTIDLEQLIHLLTAACG